jgi:hypothetical protein
VDADPAVSERRGKLARKIVGMASVAPLFALAACSSPADVTADHERAVRGHQEWLRSADATYRDDLAFAEEWNDHFMGIPAAGWVPILVFACLLATILLVVAGISVYTTFEDKRHKAHDLALDHEKTLRVAAERGGCHMCGALPVTIADEKNKR